MYLFDRFPEKATISRNSVSSQKEERGSVGIWSPLPDHLFTKSSGTLTKRSPATPQLRVVGFRSRSDSNEKGEGMREGGRRVLVQPLFDGHRSVQD